jgi:hypothetical protein
MSKKYYYERDKPREVGPQGSYDTSFICPRDFGGIFAIAVSPKRMTGAMRSFWEMCGRTLGRKYRVEKFPLKWEDIVDKFHENRVAIFIPPEVTLPDLAKLFPNLKSKYLSDPGLVVNKVNNSGWLWIDQSPIAPNREASVDELEALFLQQGRQGQSLRTYVIGAVMSKFFNGKHFDENIYMGMNQQDTSSMLLGSCSEGGYILADINTYYNSLVICPAIKGRDKDVGGRSEQAIKTSPGFRGWFLKRISG